MNGESQNIEWKESWRDEYLKWISGFANAQGGTIVIGKNDEGSIVGLKDAAKLMEEIPNKVRDVLGILVDVNLHKEADKDYITIEVPPYPYPVSYKGQYHYRSGSTKQELKGAALDKLLLQKQGKRWDGVPVPNVSITDLSNEAFSIFRKKATQSKRLAEDILDEGNDLLVERLQLKEGSYLKRAAVILFHPDPEKFVTGACVKIGFFRTNTDLLFQDVIQGSLFQQVEKTLDLLFTKYLKAAISYEKMSRLETFPFPEAALRESLFNALAHKDYSSGIPVQISVYDDKIVFWNAGQLPDNWTIDRLTQKHPSVPYNPDIAAAFFRAGYIESWGRGIEKINDACEAAGTPLPVFNTEFSGLMVTFKSATVEEKVGERVGEKVGEKVGENLTENQKQILQQMDTNPYISAPQLAKAIGISIRKIETNIQKLRNQGRLKRIGSAKGGHWEVAD